MVDLILAEKVKFAFVVIGSAQITVTVKRKIVARCLIHDELDSGIRIGVNHKIEMNISWNVIGFLIFFMDAVVVFPRYIKGQSTCV